MPAFPPAPELACQLLIPFAGASAPACRAALPGLRLPHLQALLAELLLLATDCGDEQRLSPPHERALAQALGLRRADGSACADGQIPWAAALSHSPTQPQAWFTPCHYAVGSEQVRLLPGDQIGLSDAESRALCDALAPYCAEDGIELRFDSATRWHASGAALRAVVCASLDRVSGCSLQGWMTESPANLSGRPLLQRLQSEAQLLFYSHPLHDARSARGLLPVNGFWISGAGALDQAPALQPAPTQPAALRWAALRADWAAWQQAWVQLDATEIAAAHAAVRRGVPLQLSLCGERNTYTWASAPRAVFARMGRRLRQRLAPTPIHKTLELL
ncbi:phosphoglycerate mutase [Hydrogenophaga sp.]|uniref:phosphoglycerate mutase n=1 Tax=Hydrogenophaga sp. TaxID=1904254 RepID=UPI0019C39648|nr:phosphoglycerate mutase [Hydrogenophaga sp.]MBD3893159.1 phosphoglycerate mutase [Hydrogenophaga sp.]